MHVDALREESPAAAEQQEPLPLKLFTVLLMAKREAPDEPGCTMAVTTAAYGPLTLEVLAFLAAHKAWPTEQGWTDHRIEVSEVLPEHVAVLTGVLTGDFEKLRECLRQIGTAAHSPPGSWEDVTRHVVLVLEDKHKPARLLADLALRELEAGDLDACKGYLRMIITPPEAG